ncbi:hypothetical protein [Spirosoma flavum]|uniref:DUF4251 domain-containing protein n=1 Tax=Spirosoma flavum TaxID=2048557 RepID=A0ABW6AIL8_9BACT
MKNILCVLSLLTFFDCSNKDKTHQPTGTETVQRMQDTVETSRVQSGGIVSDKPLSKNDISARAATWTYEEIVDKPGSTIYKASITSPNILDFTFPYAGGSTATLTIRHRNEHNTVYLEVSKGQFNRSFQGGNARIRFDNKPSTNYSFSAAENGRANIIFFDSEQALIDRIQAADKLLIDVEFYAQGRRQIEFRTAGLNWDH